MVNITKIAKRITAGRFSGDITLLLKEFGYDKISERLSLLYNEIWGVGRRQKIDVSPFLSSMENAIVESFNKAFPGEKIDFGGFRRPIEFNVHEVLHLVIDPGHEVQGGGSETSKNPIEGGIDEIIIAVIDDPDLGEEGETEANVVDIITGYIEEGMIVKDFLQTLSQIPLENKNKERLWKETLSTTSNHFRTELDKELDMGWEHLKNVPTVDAIKFTWYMVEELKKKVKDYISYIPPERETKYKTFVRLLHKRLDDIEQEFSQMMESRTEM